MRLLNELGASSSILRASARGAALRNEIISSNLATADVPGFTARGVEFEERLAERIGNWRPRVKPTDLEDFEAAVFFRYERTQMRNDGSNLDIDAEMVALYQNQMKFETMLASLTANSERMQTVLRQGGG